MRVAVCTDDADCMKSIYEDVKNIKNCTVRCFSTIFGFVTYICDEIRGELDILYMDEQVAKENGIEAAGDIQRLFPELKVVFLTKGNRRTEDFFMARPVFLLTKPIRKEAVQQSIARIAEDLKQEEGKVLTLTFKGCTYRIPVHSIYYIESQGRKLYIYTTGLLREVNMTMEEMIHMLPDNFYQCHRSYIVNLDRIQNLLPGEIELSNKRILPIARGRYEEVKEKIKYL